jgi:hypothetical protein
MTQQDVDRLLREAHRHWFEDGLPEMALGLLFLAIGGYLALRVALVTSGLLAGVVSVTLPLLIVAYALGMRSLVFALKKRYTLPHRAHSLRPPGEWQRRWALTISGGALAILIVWGTAQLAREAGRPAGDWMPLLIALAIGVTYLYLGNRLFLVRFYVIAALSGLWGALSGVIAVGGNASALYFGLLGLSVLISGLYHLTLYLRARPRSQGPTGNTPQPSSEE